jgi:hypothetical protein
LTVATGPFLIIVVFEVNVNIRSNGRGDQWSGLVFVIVAVVLIVASLAAVPLVRGLKALSPSFLDARSVILTSRTEVAGFVCTAIGNG